MPLHLRVNIAAKIEDIVVAEGYEEFHGQGAHFRETEAYKEIKARNLLGKKTSRQQDWAEHHDEIRRKTDADEITMSPWPNRNIQAKQTEWIDRSAQGCAAN